MKTVMLAALLAGSIGELWGSGGVSAAVVDGPRLRVAEADVVDKALSEKVMGAPGGDTASPSRKATADNIVIVDGPATIRIKHVEIAGSSLSDSDVAALFATTDAAVLEQRLRKLDAASIVLPEISVDRSDGKGEAHFVQVQVLLADVHAGRASTGSAGSATLSIKDADANSMVTVGATTFKGLDIAQVVHLATGPRSGDEPLRPLCDDVAVNAVTIAGNAMDGQPLTIATVHAAGLKGRPLAASLPDGSGKGKANAALLDDLAHSVAFDVAEADGLAVAPTAGVASSGLKSFALKHVGFRGLAGGKLANFAVNGLVAEGNDKQPGSLRLASAEIHGVGASGTEVPSIDTIDLRDLALDVPVAPAGRPEERVAFTVAHAAYEAPGLVIGKLPPRAALSVEHIIFDLPPNSGAAPVLLAMGYKHLDVSSQSASRYDPAAKALTIDRFSLSEPAMGTLELKLGMADVSQDIVSQNDEVQKAAAAAIVLKSFDLTVRNAGLIDKAIAFKAAIDGVGVDQERTNITQLIDTGLVGMDLQGSAKAQLIVAALHKFVSDPKTLHIALSSKDGLGAGSMALVGDPKALLDALDVTADANR